MSVETTIKNLALDLHNIGLSPTSLSKTTSTIKRSNEPQVADSWEDDASDDEKENINNGNTTTSTKPLVAPGPTHLKSPESRAIDAARELDSNLDLNSTDVPPPTPISPSLTGVKPLPPPPSSARPSQPRPQPQPSSSRPSSYNTSESDRRRPEKTTATANRLIAGALGIRAPPRTEEQKKYERAVREAEARKRNKEKEDEVRRKEEDERAKRDVWES